MPQLFHQVDAFTDRPFAGNPAAVFVLEGANPTDERMRQVAREINLSESAFLRAMLAFEAGISDRTSPEACAQEIARALDDDSDRLRYPVAAYARPIVSARRLLGGQRIMRFFHTRWMGKNA